MLVTRQWIDSISDQAGLTRGQQQLLSAHLGGLPYVGKLLDDKIAKHVEQCRGWRKTPTELEPGKTGWPPGLLQDDSRELSRWFASQPGARRVVRESLQGISNKTPTRPVSSGRH